MESLASATAMADCGFSGCAHARAASKRQVLLVDRETLDAMDLQPGIIRETSPPTASTSTDSRLASASVWEAALLEVSAVCTPCDQLERVRPGLRREIYGRRGCYVASLRVEKFVLAIPSRDYRT